MVAQRIKGGASLEVAVLELLQGLPVNFWPNPCKRIREWLQHGKTPSSHTGGYNQARQTLPLSIVQKSCDRIFCQLMAQLGKSGNDDSPGAFILDGSSIRTANSPQSCECYPPGSNQHGESHWPMLRVLVAHDVYTGLAMRPEWGPMNSSGAVSEQGLLERAIDRLPHGATVIGDANFGVFSVANVCAQHQHPVLLRMTLARARRLAGAELQDGTDLKISWKPSRGDRRSHPDLPAEACVEGRLLVRRVSPSDGKAAFLLAFFTTLSSPVEEVYGLYAQRWAVETDLRTLKDTLCMDQLTCGTPDMVAKEIETTIAAYNLVRALMVLASQQSGIPPRGYSFTKVRHILHTFGPLLAQAPDEVSAQKILDQMLRYLQQSKLPSRKRKRPSFPRAVWAKGSTFPHRRN